MGGQIESRQADRAAYAPAKGVFAITPNNVTVFDNVGANSPMPRSLYIGVGGNIAIVTEDGSSGVLTVPGGFVLPVSVRQVLATGTTATSIFGLY